MPLAAPVIAALIGAGVTGVTTGLEASGTIGGGGGPSQATLTAEQNAAKEAQNKQDALTKAEAFKAFAPDAQAQTGGALSDASFANLVAELSGQPGNMALAQQTIFGNTGTAANTGLASG